MDSSRETGCKQISRTDTLRTIKVGNARLDSRLMLDSHIKRVRSLSYILQTEQCRWAHRLFLSKVILVIPLHPGLA